MKLVINKKRTEKIWIIRDLITIITTMARAIMGPVETEITVVTDLVETGGRNNRGGQGIMAFILLTLVALFVYALISNSISHASTQEKSYSDFIKQLDKGNVKSVEFDSYEIDYKLVDDGHKDYDITYYTGRVADDELVPTLKKAKTSEGKSIEIKAAIPG